MDNETLSSLIANLMGFVVGVPLGALWGIWWAREQHVSKADVDNSSTTPKEDP